MRFQMCAALAIVAAAGIAQAQDWNRDRDRDRGHDQTWRRQEDRQGSHDRYQSSRGQWNQNQWRSGDRYNDHRHDWVRYDNRWRYWDRDRWVYGVPEFVEVGPSYGSVFDLNIEIGNLDLQIRDLQRGHWYRGRDERIADLRAQIRRDRDRVEWMRHH